MKQVTIKYQTTRIFRDAIMGVKWLMKKMPQMWVGKELKMDEIKSSWSTVATRTMGVQTRNATLESDQTIMNSLWEFYNNRKYNSR